jgi:hypothetical protein
MTANESLGLLMGWPPEVRQVTTYGRPSDPFIKIRETATLQGGVLNVNREITARGYFQAFQCEVAFSLQDQDTRGKR